MPLEIVPNYTCKERNYKSLERHHKDFIFDIITGALVLNATLNTRSLRGTARKSSLAEFGLK